MSVNRRNFLKFAGGSVLGLGGISFVNACSGLKRDDLSALQDKEDMMKGLERNETEILRLASLAPSGHNAQPWTVKVVEPKHWIIGSDKRRWLPAVDPENRVS